MRKIISFAGILILFTLFFSINSYAASLDTISINTDKTTIRPGSEVKLTINFGVELGEYTFNIAYDNKIFDFVSVEGGTENDTKDKVKVTFYDTQTPRENMSIIFRAKEDITSSNPTEFTVVSEKLSTADGSTVYDNITTPMVKNVIVEPEFIDYKINLTHTGEIIKGEAKDMKLSFASSMGRFYEHARLIAEATTPSGATFKLTGINKEENVEQDIIKSGWGDPQGYKIGGKDFSQVLNLKALFSNEGEYTIILKLIDRDNSDNVISENKFKFTVLAQATTDQGETKTEVPPVETPNNTKTQTPKVLPKTGFNIYIPMGMTMIAIISLGVYYNTKNKK